MPYKGYTWGDWIKGDRFNTLFKKDDQDIFRIPTYSNERHVLVEWTKLTFFWKFILVFKSHASLSLIKTDCFAPLLWYIKCLHCFQRSILGFLYENTSAGILWATMFDGIMEYTWCDKGSCMLLGIHEKKLPQWQV